jgi:hypothetical protein
MKHLLTILLLVVAAAPAALAQEDDPGKPAMPATPMPPAPMYTEPFAEFVSPEDSLPRLRFFEGDQVSLNDRCPVRRVKLNPKMGAHYVNGRPVGFC